MSTHTPRFLLTSEPFEIGEPGLRFTVRPVYIADDDGTLRNYTESSFDSEPMADLVITAQVDYVTDSAYGFRVEYRDTYAVDLARAETMTKTLRKITRGLERMEKQLGYVESFSAFVARVAVVLGVTDFGWKTDAAWADGGYRWTDASGFASRIATETQTFKRAHA